MVKVVIIIPMVINSLENSKKEKLMVLANFITLMVIDILVDINMILKMARELIFIKMGKDILENLKKE